MPFKGFEDLRPSTIEAFARAGHGRRVIIADRSLDYASTDEVVSYGGNSAQALHRSLQALYREGPVVLMYPNEHNRIEDVRLRAFGKFLKVMDLNNIPTSEIVLATPSGEATRYTLTKEPVNISIAVLDEGFYALRDRPNESRLIVQTEDTDPFACASFIVGHNQDGQNQFPLI